MGRKNRLFSRGQELELDIIDLAFGGKGIAKVDTDDGDFTVFVANSIPGQRVKAKVKKSKRRYAECILVDVIKHADDEISVPYQKIPGAPYISLPIKNQTELKKRTTKELYKRIGNVQNIDDLFDEYVLSPSVYHYRNKMEYSFSAIGFDLEKKHDVDEFSFGFKHRGTWWMVENLDKDSGLFDADFENKMINIREWAINTGLPAWHPPRKEGFFRHLVVRKSYHNNQLLLNLVTSSTDIDKFDKDEFVKLLLDLFGDRIAGIFQTINNDVGDRIEILAGNTELLYGEPKIVEVINGLEFEISMSSFFQTNPKCAERLYNKVIDYVGDNTGEDKYIMDLFCGTGTISQLLAQHTGNKIVGVDIVQSAIDDAKKNAERNNVSDIDFYAFDVGKFLKEYPHYKGKIDKIVLDPPRAGIAPKTLLKVIALDAETIVYVSCNPATQARDTIALRENGYEMVKISFVDQFPHTSHIEAIAVYEKKKLTKLDKEFWSDRWKNNTTGWDIGEISRPIKEYIDQLEDKSIKILIPGAGNAHEGEYLWKQGFTNVHIIDISEYPLASFQERNPNFPKENLICADFFDFNESFDLVIEQTFFCALNPQLRKKYVKKMNEILKTNGKLVGVMFDFPLTDEGPPFGGSTEEYKSSFSEDFSVEIMDRCINSIEPRQGRELFVKMIKK